MKKIGTTVLAICLTAFTFGFQAAQAQDVTKADREKELRMQEEIDAQKKAILEQKKAMDEQQKEQLQLQKKIQAEMDLARIATDSVHHFDKFFRNFNEDIVVPDFQVENDFHIGNVTPFLYWNRGGDGEGTSWDFSKSMKENSYSGDYSFDVEPAARSVVMSVNGDCKQGEIRIKITMPGGKTYSDILIDEYGNLNWRKSFNITDQENKDKTGTWKFHISASKATGFFRISLQTY
jgi:hypothetical protein